MFTQAHPRDIRPSVFDTPTPGPKSPQRSHATPFGDGTDGGPERFLPNGLAEEARAAREEATHVLRTANSTKADGIASVAAEIEAIGAKVTYRSTTTLPTVHVIADDNQIAAIGQLPAVTRVSENVFIPVATTRVRTGVPWNLDRIDRYNAAYDGRYLYRRDGSGVLTYVVDTGISYDPEALAGLYYLPGDPVQWFDCEGHGSHVAGTLADETYGIATGSTLIVVKASFGCPDPGTSSGFSLAALDAALDAIVSDRISRGSLPAVVNLSLGGAVAPGADQLDDKVDFLSGQGITVVVAAGNDNEDACGFSPARAPSAITVGATTTGDVRASFSNFGDCVDIFAPGVAIPSWYPIFDDTCVGFRNLCGVFRVEQDGTSMAAPLVAGLAALFLESRPGASPAEVKAMLQTESAPVVTNRSGSPNRLTQSGFLLPHTARIRLSDAALSSIPDTGVGALTLSVKVFNPSQRALIAVFPCDAENTAVSSTDVPGGSIGQTTVISSVSAAGGICIEARDGALNPVAVDRMIVFVTGWFAEGEAFTPFSPIRIIDES